MDKEYFSAVGRRTRSKTNLFIEGLYKRSKGLGKVEDEKQTKCESSVSKPSSNRLRGRLESFVTEPVQFLDSDEDASFNESQFLRKKPRMETDSDSDVVFVGEDTHNDAGDSHDELLFNSQNHGSSWSVEVGVSDKKVTEVEGVDRGANNEEDCMDLSAGDSFVDFEKVGFEEKHDFDDEVANFIVNDYDRDDELKMSGSQFDSDDFSVPTESENGYEDIDYEVSNGDGYELISSEDDSHLNEEDCDDNSSEASLVASCCGQSRGVERRKVRIENCIQRMKGVGPFMEKEGQRCGSRTQTRASSKARKLPIASEEMLDEVKNKINGDDTKGRQVKCTGEKDGNARGQRKLIRGTKDVQILEYLVSSICNRDDKTEEDTGSMKERLCELDIEKSVPRRDSTEETIPLKFTFGVEETDPVEKSEYDKEMEKLWEDMEFALQSERIDRFDSSQVEADESNEPTTTASLCSQGRHHLILVEDIGIYCKYCSYVDVEIRYVSPTVEREQAWWTKFSSTGDEPLFKGLDFANYSDGSWDCCDQNEGTVWKLIPGIKKTMYQHQQEGFEFIWKNMAGSIYLDQVNNDDRSHRGGCIISHAPGTGKTRLTIVFLQSYLQLFPKCSPLIIAPASILHTWEIEFQKWAEGIKFYNLSNAELSEEEIEIDSLDGYSFDRRNKRVVRMVKLHLWMQKRSVLGISYNLYEKLAGEKCEDKKKANKTKELPKANKENKEIRKLLQTFPGLLVLDEGHTPRNQRSQIWKVLWEIRTKKRIILSGTPFQNNFLEFYNTLCLARPSFPKEIPESLRKFCQRKMKQDIDDTSLKPSHPGLCFKNQADREISKLRSLMDPFVHVHKGDILQKNLPGLRDFVVMLNPDDLQKTLLGKIERSQNVLDFEYKSTLVSIHPSLLLHCSLSREEESAIDMRALKALRLEPIGGAKTRFVVEFVQLCSTLSERVLVFSQFIRPLRLLIDQLNKVLKWSEGDEVLCILGTLDQKKRQSVMNRFNDPNSEAKILFVSTKACCEGINLVGASRVVLLDIVWNPSVERQAISRAYRLGQKRIVYTYHLFTTGSSECEKYCKQSQKDRLSELVFSSKVSEHDNQDDYRTVSDDRVLEEMVQHDRLKDMFNRIIFKPKLRQIS